MPPSTSIHFSAIWRVSWQQCCWCTFKFQSDTSTLTSNLKTSEDQGTIPYQYRDTHYKDKTVSRPSYLYNGNPHTWKDRLYIETGLRWQDIWLMNRDAGFHNAIKRSNHTRFCINVLLEVIQLHILYGAWVSSMQSEPWRRFSQWPGHILWKNIELTHPALAFMSLNILRWWRLVVMARDRKQITL